MALLFHADDRQYTLSWSQQLLQTCVRCLRVGDDDAKGCTQQLQQLGKVCHRTLRDNTLIVAPGVAAISQRVTAIGT